MDMAGKVPIPKSKEHEHVFAGPVLQGGVYGGKPLRRFAQQTGTTVRRRPSILSSSSATQALGFTQPLIKMSTRNKTKQKKPRPARKDDNLTAICEPIV
jgi:hypothetical protein